MIPDKIEEGKKTGRLGVYLSEFLGSFFLLLFGSGSIMMFQVQPEVIDPITIPFIFGGTMMLMIYTFGNISGAHLNPAVTIGFWAVKRFPSKFLFGHILSQFWGYTFAIIVLNYIWDLTDNDFGITKVMLDLEVGFLFEFLLSFIMMIVIASVAKGYKIKGEKAGTAVGLIICLSHLVAGPLTGSSLNPFRSILPAIALRDFTHLWLYIVAPILGCVLGAICFEFIKKRQED